MAFQSKLGDGDGLWATPLLLLAVAFLGIAHVAFLPPFEGYDETAHYSYIQQVADTGRIPQLGIDNLSRDVESYPGPLPAGVNLGQEPPRDRSYRAFFEGDFRPLPELVTRAYAPGAGGNWEAQQPPVYYFAMAPFYSLTRNWSWQSQLLLLRLVSWGMAFAGFATGCRATQRTLKAMGRSASLTLLPAAWPLFFPEFFPEMARLGNDSLCLLLAAIAWVLILRLLKAPDRRVAISLGLILGLGLLTKAFFLPIAAGTGLLLALAAGRRRRTGRVADVIVAVGLAALIGMGWYLRRLLLGSLAGSIGLVAVERQGGVLGLLEQGVSGAMVLNMLHGLAIIAGSFVWAGTWSRAILFPLLQLPVLLLAVGPFALWLRRLGRLPIEGAAPLFLAAPFLFGLICYDIAHNLLPGAAPGTPGWYLHILAAPLSLALALGWQRPRLFGLLAAYALLFHVACWATQLSFFSGCAYKPGAHMSLRLDPGSCLIVPSRLAALGEPMLGGAALLAAAILGGMALLAVIRQGRPAADRSSPTGTR